MIKELTLEEAQRLRALVRDRFCQSPYNGAGLKISQYKNSYQHLADDIARVLPDMKSSVSTHRLRKLFYFTNPDVCEADKMEKPSFGHDFIQALFKYVETGEIKPETLPPPFQKTTLRRQHRKWIGLALLLLTAAAVWIWKPAKNLPEKWEEHFDSVSVDSLQSRGWKILDYDSVSFGRQLKPGCLTLYTLMGDTWVDWAAGDKPMIRNLLVKPIGSSNCLITARLAGGFDPNQNWQQAGVFLYDKDLSQKHIFRVTFAVDCNNNGINFYERRITVVQKIQAILTIENQQPVEIPWGVRDPKTQPVYSDVGFYLVITGKKLIINFWLDGEWKSIQDAQKREMDLPFVPAYVGIGAFQGKRTNNDTIPVFFDYVKVAPLSE